MRRTKTLLVFVSLFNIVQYSGGENDAPRSFGAECVGCLNLGGNRGYLGTRLRRRFENNVPAVSHKTTGTKNYKAPGYVVYLS